MKEKEQSSVFPGAKKFLKNEVAIEQLAQEHEAFLKERDEVAHKYKIIGEGVKKLEYKDGHWYFNGTRVDQLDDFDDTSGLPNYTGQR